jgi:hypothetical protein
MGDVIYHNVVGRMVQGDLFTPQDKDMNGNPMRDLKGNPKVQYFAAIAVRKDDPAFAPAWAAIQAEATGGFPGG